MADICLMGGGELAKSLSAIGSSLWRAKNEPRVFVFVAIAYGLPIALSLVVGLTGGYQS